MLVFKKIEFKNIFSYGNTITEFNFEDGLYGISGSNGCGKSTILDVLFFALFNKPFKKVPKKKIINFTNGRDCVTKLWFSKNGVEYLVVRGINPNVFEIYKDDELIKEEAHTKSYQDILNDIVGLSPEITRQIILIDNNFIPFYSLNAAQRRTVIEQLLSLEDIGKLNLLNKDNISRCNGNIQLYKRLIENSKSTIESHKLTLQEIESKEKNTITTEDITNEYQERIDVVINEIETLNTELESKNEAKVDKTIAKLEKGIIDVKKSIVEFKTKIKLKKEQIDFFSKNNSCNQCLQDITDDIKEKQLLSLNTELTNFTDDLEENNNVLKSINDLLEKQNDKLEVIDNIKNKIDTKKRSLKTLTSERDIKIKVISNIDNNDDSETIVNSLIDKEHQNYTKYQKDLSDEEYSLKQFKQLELVFSDGGFKKAIMDDYIGFIEDRINHYLEVFDIFATIEFDEDFNEIIRFSGFNEVLFDGCSNGQKARITISTILAFRELLDMRGVGSSNLLIIDEVFDAALDVNGRESLLRNLKTLVNKGDKCICIISHATDLPDLFDTEYHVKINGHFSEIKKVS